MNDYYGSGNGYRESDTLFNLIIKMQMRRNEYNRTHGIHRQADILYLMNGNPDLAGNIPENDKKFFRKEVLDYTSANNLLPFVSFEELQDMRRQFIQYDKSINAVENYTSSSSEFLFMNILQYYFEPDSRGLEWVITGKMIRGNSLLSVNSPNNDGKKGLLAETASIFDTLTGNGTDGTNPFYMKVREKLPIRVINAMIKFSEAAYEISSNPENNNNNLLPPRYHIRDMIVIGKRHEPYASTDEQEKIIPALNNLYRNLNAVESFRKYSFGLELTAASLTENTEINRNNPLAAVRRFPN